jgi:hypothetical protein
MSHGLYRPGQPRRSPLKLTVRKDPIFLQWASEEPDPAEAARLLKDAISYRWKADERIKMALFRHRQRPEWYAILHPSTKEPGRWQLSTFDEDGSWGDVIRDTPDKALKEGIEGYGKQACEEASEVFIRSIGVAFVPDFDISPPPTPD